jgi:hypothetical protein
MPSLALKHLADKQHISAAQIEELWDKAKQIVSKEYGSPGKVKNYWALVMSITKKMMGLKEGISFKEFLVFENLLEASYEGNLGMMEMFKFYEVATPEQKQQMKSLLQNEKQEDAWELLQQVTKVKLK